MNACATIEEYSHFFEVKLDLFDGPIDLLLHLVKSNELPIEKLSLAQVANQYLECLETMRYFDLEIAGEYLVIAATLLSIKSSVLLNEPVQLVVDVDGNLVDPHELLLRKLREAQIYKDSVAHLNTRKLLDVDVFARAESFQGVDLVPAKLKNHDAYLLGKAFRKLLLQAERSDSSIAIMLESVSVVDCMMKILRVLKESEGVVPFVNLVPDLTSRMSVIGSFVALLELCKRHVIKVRQSEIFENIDIVLAVDNFDPEEFYEKNGQLESEFDNQESLDETANG